MGGGEIARYLSTYGAGRVHGVVFDSSVTPYLSQTTAHPDGPPTMRDAARATAAFVKDQDAFYDQQMTEFFTANGQLRASAATRTEALAAVWSTVIFRIERVIERDAALAPATTATTSPVGNFGDQPDYPPSLARRSAIVAPPNSSMTSSS